MRHRIEAFGLRAQARRRKRLVRSLRLPRDRGISGFLYLASAASFEVTPSKAVDAAWHLHLEDEAHYRGALCERLLGRIIEHRPGTNDSLEDERFREQYRRTLSLYETVFGPAPADIWPQRAGGASDTSSGRSSDRLWFLAIGLALAGTVVAALLHPAAVYIGLGLTVGLAICFAIGRAARSARRRREAGQCGGCGGGCGGD